MNKINLGLRHGFAEPHAVKINTQCREVKGENLHYSMRINVTVNKTLLRRRNMRRRITAA